MTEPKTGAIEEYLRVAYDDEHLAMLQAHAESGKLAYYSCCCLIGIPTVDHTLRGEAIGPREIGGHYPRPGFKTPLEAEAETQFKRLGGDHKRRTRLLSLIYAEQRRREIDRLDRAAYEAYIDEGGEAYATYEEWMEAV